MTEGSIAPRPLRAIAAVMDAYRQVFVQGRTAPLLSRSKPVRHSGFDMQLIIEEVRAEVPDVVSLTLRSPTGDLLPRWSPGSHLDLILPSGRQRQYSLCGNPDDRMTYRIAVRRIPDGDGGSIEVHERLCAGDRLGVRGPRNAFSFVDAPSYLFIAAGIGITPILPMARAAGARGQLVYVGRTRDSMPFLDELPEAAEVRPDDEFGVPDIAELIACTEPGAAVYVCGPPPVLEAAQRRMFELNPTGSLHPERVSAPPVIDGREFDLTLARSGKTVRVGAEETALAAIRRELPGTLYSCQQGFCGTCKTRVIAGAIDHRDRFLTDAERGEQMLTCVSRAAGDCLVLDL